MLTRARKAVIQGHAIETPLVVPSFSSKGFPKVGKIIETLSETITDCALISAYDLARGYITAPPTFPALLFLDSGGYESSKDTELSDTRTQNFVETSWKIDELRTILDTWQAAQPTVVVSYDHPKQRVSVKEQITRARSLFDGRPFGREILLKPASEDSARISMNDVIANIYDLREFDVIGFTEKELGFSIFDRMSKLAKLRVALTNIGLEIPIHIFGSLDTVSTPLYFLAGADIFDGLTWLRYSYVDGQAVYTRNAAALKYGIRVNDQDIDPKIWFDNYQQIMNLQLAMKRYLKEHDFKAFKGHAEFFEQCSKELETTL